MKKGEQVHKEEKNIRIAGGSPAGAYNLRETRRWTVEEAPEMRACLVEHWLGFGVLWSIEGGSAQCQRERASTRGTKPCTWSERRTAK